MEGSTYLLVGLLGAVTQIFWPAIVIGLGIAFYLQYFRKWPFWSAAAAAPSCCIVLDLFYLAFHKGAWALDHFSVVLKILFILIAVLGSYLLSVFILLIDPRKFLKQRVE